MRLESFEIRNYRSIANVSIEPCGDFNVLIGRNNSGKSNILGSIDAFFATVGPEIINTRPTVGDEIDFFQREIANSIEFCAVFDPTDSELQKLLTEIASERPQVKKLLEEIGSDALLAICVSVTATQQKFAFVRSITLQTEDASRTIFEIDFKVATELHSNVVGMERKVAENRGLNRTFRQFDIDDYASVKRSTNQSPYSGPPADYYFRRFTDDDAATTSELSKLFQSSDTFESFKSSISNLIKANETAIEALSRRPITLPIKTFTGEENTVPQYVKQLLARVHETRILHFKERRAPIGSEEAKRLLSLKIKRGGTDVLARIQSTIDELLGVRPA